MGDLSITVLAAEEGGQNNFLLPNGTFIFVLLIFATALLVASLVFLVMLVALNRRMAQIERRFADHERLVDEALQLLRILLGDLLDGDVVRQVAVVLGESFIDLDGEPQLVGDRSACLDRADLGAAHQAGDREAGQRVGQPRRLRHAVVGQARVGALPGLAPPG